MSCRFRPCTAADIPELMRIQAASFVANLPAQERRDGFLSVAFEAEPLAGINREIPIVVAELGER